MPKRFGLAAALWVAAVGGTALAAPPDAGGTAAPEEVKPADAAPVKPADAAPVKPPGTAPVKPADAAPVKPPGAAPVKPADAAPVEPAEAAPVKPARAALPDGTFVGELSQADRRWVFRVTVVAGMVVSAEVERGGSAGPLALKPVGAPDDVALRLSGSEGTDFLKLEGAFFDIERASGSFDGALARKRFQGTWVLARR